MQNHFVTASQKASDPQSNSGQNPERLVIISDCHDTLFSIPGRAYNKELFAYLVEMKQQGHHVFLTSARGGSGTVIDLMAPRHNVSPDFFHVREGETTIENSVILKDKLEGVLKSLGISKVDEIFDDKAPSYLGDIEVVRHIGAEIFLNPENFLSRNAAGIASPSP